MSEKKKKYGVSVVWTCSKYREIEAHSKEEAEQIAEDEIDEPSICHQCSREIESDLNYLETIVEEIEAVSSELDQLRADLKAMGRVEGLVYFGEDFKVRFNEKLKAIRDKIAKLEAEAEADPWREAKQFASAYRDPKGSSYLQKLIAHYDHLSAEVARLTERVAELEDVKPIADMQPPFEGPIVGIEPVLEPNRVLATAVEALAIRRLAAQTRDRLTTLCNNAKPYQLKKGGE